MLDELPPWARHLAIVAGAVLGGSIAAAVITAGGVTGVDWPAALRAAIDEAAVAVAAAAAGLWLTPLTRQYGIGSGR
jgi:hypothetical protein